MPVQTVEKPLWRVMQDNVQLVAAPQRPAYMNGHLACKRRRKKPILNAPLYVREVVGKLLPFVPAQVGSLLRPYKLNLILKRVSPLRLPLLGSHDSVLQGRLKIRIDAVGHKRVLLPSARFGLLVVNLAHASGVLMLAYVR
jgi:hypothetical protein